MYACAHMCFEPENRTGARGFLHLVAHKWRQTPQASGSKRRREGGEAKVLGEPFRSADPQTTRAHGDCALVLGSIRQNGAAAFRDTPCPQHLGPGGGVLHSYALISDHRPVQSQDQRIDSETSMKNTRSCSGVNFFFLFWQYFTLKYWQHTGS